MRTLLVLAALLAPSAALADNDHSSAVAGTFDVKYEEVTSNCQNTGIVLNRGTIDISKKRANGLQIDIERMPLMTGTASKGGRLKAASKLGKTSIQGLDGKFSTAGTVNPDGVLTVVFVAEYYLNGKAYCTQSWNVTGTRAAAPSAPKRPAPAAELTAPTLAPWDLNAPMM